LKKLNKCAARHQWVSGANSRAWRRRFPVRRPPMSLLAERPCGDAGPVGAASARRSPPMPSCIWVARRPSFWLAREQMRAGRVSRPLGGVFDDRPLTSTAPPYPHRLSAGSNITKARSPRQRPQHPFSCVSPITERRPGPPRVLEGVHSRFSTADTVEREAPLRAASRRSDSDVWLLGDHRIGLCSRRP
jgi:hypothetical protein